MHGLALSRLRGLELTPFVPSGLNIGVYQEAAEHLLSALSMHQTDSNAGQTNSFLTKDEAVNQSNNLWSSLRRAFYAMVRLWPVLVRAVESR